VVDAFNFARLLWKWREQREGAEAEFHGRTSDASRK
jgi:hypothetical protein